MKDNEELDKKMDELMKKTERGELLDERDKRYVDTYFKEIQPEIERIRAKKEFTKGEKIKLSSLEPGNLERERIITSKRLTASEGATLSSYNGRFMRLIIRERRFLEEKYQQPGRFGKADILSMRELMEKRMSDFMKRLDRDKPLTPQELDQMEQCFIAMRSKIKLLAMQGEGGKAKTERNRLKARMNDLRLAADSHPHPETAERSAKLAERFSKKVKKRVRKKR